MGTGAQLALPPEPPRDLQAEAAALIDQAGALLMQLAAQPGNDRAVSELTYAGVRFGQLSTALRDSSAGSAALAASFAAGVAHGEAQAAARMKAPRGHRAPSKRAFGLRVVPGLVAAGLALRELAKRSLPSHPAAAKAALAALVKAHPLAAAGAAGTTAATVLVASAVVTGTPVMGVHIGTAGGSPNPAATAYSATPIPEPSQSLIAAITKGAKAASASAGKVLPVTPSSLPSSSLPSLTEPSAPSAPWPTQAAAPPAAPSPAGPAVLTPAAQTGLDLNAVAQIDIQIVASGGGWAHWTVSAGGTDLDFSKTSGVLASGGVYDLLITPDASQDGATVQTIVVAGESFTITLPAPLPVPAVTPTDVAPSLPTDPPTSAGD